MSYKINLRFRRFGYGTGHPTGLNMYYIELSLPKAPGGSAVPRPHYRANLGKVLEPVTISPYTLAMDHKTIIFFMTD